jgi:hypothetical protein
MARISVHRPGTNTILCESRGFVDTRCEVKESSVTNSSKQSHNTPMEVQGGRGCIAPTHSQLQH